MTISCSRARGGFWQSIAGPMRASAFIAVVALLSEGCAMRGPTLLVGPPPPIPSYNDYAEGTPMRRVALLPLRYERGIGRYLEEVDTVFNAELNKTALFEVVPLTREQMGEIFGQEEISSIEKLPGDLMVRLSEIYGVDGIIMTDITHYHPYRPISIGVRSKLVDVRTGRIRWAFDHLFDSGSPQVADQAKRYYVANSRKDQVVGFDGKGILMSPIRFSKYAAAETYRSLVSH